MLAELSFILYNCYLALTKSKFIEYTLGGSVNVNDLLYHQTLEWSFKFFKTSRITMGSKGKEIVECNVHWIENIDYWPSAKFSW